MIALAFLLLSAFTPTFTVVTLALGSVFSLMILIRLTTAVTAMMPSDAAEPSRLGDSRLWTLTVLAPLLREKLSVVRSLVDAINALDYPTHTLDVKPLVEADDDETLRTVQAMSLPSWLEIVPVPPGEQRTSRRR